MDNIGRVDFHNDVVFGTSHPNPVFANRQDGWPKEGWNSVTEAFQFLGILDNHIEQAPLYYRHPETDEMVEVKDKRLLIRRPLAGIDSVWREFEVVGKDYETMPANRLAEYLDPLARQWPVYSAGWLDKGRKIFVTLLRGTYDLGGDPSERHASFLMFMDDYSGRGALRIGLTSMRFYCCNCLPVAWASGKDRMTIPHDSDPALFLKLRVKWELEMEQMAREHIGPYEDMMRFALNDHEVEEVINRALPLPRDPANQDINILGNNLMVAGHITQADVERAQERRRQSEYEYEMARSRTIIGRTAVHALLEAFNEERPTYARTAYAVMQAIDEFVDFGPGRGDRATQVIAGKRGAIKTRAQQDLLDMMTQR